jgi:endo-1,4-beta-D-glucanase Y
VSQDVFGLWGAIAFLAAGGCSNLAGGDSGPGDAGAAATDVASKSDGLTASFTDSSIASDGRPRGDSATAAESAAPPMRGPTPPNSGANFPFPQNRQSKNCIYPSGYRNEAMTAAYMQWKGDTVTASGAGAFRRVQRLPSDSVPPALGSTVSEGIAYGMLIAVYMNDQPLFDDLWKYEQLHLGKCPPSPGACPSMQLMDWNIAADGSSSLGTGGATDADEDMAFALVMADRQWGGKGSLAKTYLEFAIDQITAVWVLEVYQSSLIKPGTWGDSSTLNISYFSPAYYRVFKTVGGTLPMGDSGTWNANWDATIDSVYRVINSALNSSNGNQSNGLVPAWCTSGGVPNSSAIAGGNAANYQYDSCRTPFRIALDWCWFGEPRAQAYLAKTSAFFTGVGAQNVADGYALDGRPQPQNPGKLSAAFIGPAGVGAMSASTFQPFLDGAYAAVATRGLLAGGLYYEDSWTALSLLMMTGNFLNYLMVP